MNIIIIYKWQSQVDWSYLLWSSSTIDADVACNEKIK